MKAFRFAHKLRELSRDPLSKYWKIKICKGTKQPACRWSDPRNHQKDPIDKTSYNTAVLTGPINNLLVVDVDVKDQGMDEFKKYITSHGSPNTLTVSTPSGGLHLYLTIARGTPKMQKK